MQEYSICNVFFLYWIPGQHLQVFEMFYRLLKHKKYICYGARCEHPANWWYFEIQLLMCWAVKTGRDMGWYLNFQNHVSGQTFAFKQSV